VRVVIDCNVLVSAARIDGVCRKVIGEVVRRHEIVLSEPILTEYETVAGRPKHARYRAALRANISELERLAIFVQPETAVFGLRDPDDEIYLATATAGGAALITGNSRDFTEPRYGPVEVYSPRSFLERSQWASRPRPCPR